MKKISTIACFMLLLGSLTACSDSDAVDYGLGAYYTEIVTAAGDRVFLLDTGQSVRSVGKGTADALEAGDRVRLLFSYLNGKTDEIVIHSATKIFRADLNTVRPEAIPLQANDPIAFESAWIGSHYLNLQFYMEYQSEAHKVMLSLAASEANDREPRLYFRHDRNGDAPGYLLPVCVSFDLSRALGEPKGDRTLLINFNTTNYGDKTYKFKY
ncbi:MAG: hypothetical protein LBH61_04565 [Dysgonamonadaceae bacterium]|jgi:hypothetical protein|nr:hypothetical protein [Dysgonamonadaceae bacterium]